MHVHKQNVTKFVSSGYQNFHRLHECIAQLSYYYSLSTIPWIIHNLYVLRLSSHNLFCLFMLLFFSIKINNNHCFNFTLIFLVIEISWICSWKFCMEVLLLVFDKWRYSIFTWLPSSSTRNCPSYIEKICKSVWYSQTMG